VETPSPPAPPPVVLQGTCSFLGWRVVRFHVWLAAGISRVDFILVFCFSGDEHKHEKVELTADLASLGMQPSPTATVLPLHLQQTQWYGTLPWTCSCSE
jgi:hypothetical protein